jgi:transposase
MRYELNDHEWAAIKPMLPNKPRGVPRVNDRRVLNGIFWVLRSGAPCAVACRSSARSSGNFGARRAREAGGKVTWQPRRIENRRRRHVGSIVSLPLGALLRLALEHSVSGSTIRVG